MEPSNNILGIESWNTIIQKQISRKQEKLFWKQHLAEDNYTKKIQCKVTHARHLELKITQCMCTVVATSTKNFRSGRESQEIISDSGMSGMAGKLETCGTSHEGVFADWDYGSKATACDVRKLCQQTRNWKILSNRRSWGGQKTWRGQEILKPSLGGQLPMIQRILGKRRMKMKWILQGLRVAQAAVTERWP